MWRAACVASALVTASALSDLPERARGGKAWENYLSHSPHLLKASEPLIVNTKVDHFNENSTDTFAQRYYVNSQYWDGKGPVFLSIGGEGGEELNSLRLTWNLGTLNGPPGGYIAVLGQEYNALLVSLEHRYFPPLLSVSLPLCLTVHSFYGESIPNGNSFTPNLKFLTVAQALADLATFTEFYQVPLPALPP
jgi:hypothetical protein